MKLLSQINDPADLRKLPQSKLQPLADEIREYMIETLSKIGGHTGASLGPVELILALHYAFDTPRDKLVFDIGHQAYSHKIITGRRDQFPTIRQYNGLSGFLRREESEYDVFNAAHAGTSISAALGIAAARDLERRRLPCHRLHRRRGADGGHGARRHQSGRASEEEDDHPAER